MFLAVNWQKTLQDGSEHLWANISIFGPKCINNRPFLFRNYNQFNCFCSKIMRKIILLDLVHTHTHSFFPFMTNYYKFITLPNMSLPTSHLCAAISLLFYLSIIFAQLLSGVFVLISNASKCTPNTRGNAYTQTNYYLLMHKIRSPAFYAHIQRCAQHLRPL